MLIYLVQHGQAKAKDVDPNRHLTEKGQTDVKKISTFLKRSGLSVDTIWHSGKTRAIQTADILERGIVAEQGVIQQDGLTPKDDIKPIKEKLIQSDKDIMIVGHMPFLSKLASSLVTCNESANVIAFQQGGVVCLKKNDDNVWSVQWMVVPKLIT